MTQPINATFDVTCPMGQPASQFEQFSPFVGEVVFQVAPRAYIIPVADTNWLARDPMTATRILTFACFKAGYWLGNYTRFEDAIYQAGRFKG